MANFDEIIKIAIKLVKSTLKKSIKVKRVTNYELKCTFFFYFPI